MSNEKRLESKLACIRRVTALLADKDQSISAKMQQSLMELLKEVHAASGSIMLKEGSGDKLKIEAATRKELIGMVPEISPGSVSAHVLKTGEPLLVRDVHADPRFKARNKNYSTNSFISIPLTLPFKDELIGIINVSDRTNKDSFSDSDLALLSDYATWLSPLIENSMLIHELRQEREKYKKINEVLKVKQKELVISSKERAELVEMVVHDFKSPLSAIISNLDLLEYMGLKENQSKIVKTATTGANDLLDMINQFLQVARLDSYKGLDLDIGPVRIGSIIEEVLEEHRSIVEQRQIKVENLIQEGRQVIAEKSMLRHLLQNLISNAIKYNEEQGIIRIFEEVRESKRSEDVYPMISKVCVEDSGLGVPDEIKQSIFDKFKRRNSKEVDGKIQGTGIGLYICKRIVNMLNGHIWVEDCETKGSRFCFTLYAQEIN